MFNLNSWCLCFCCTEKERIAQEKYGKSYDELSTNEQKVGCHEPMTHVGHWLSVST